MTNRLAACHSLYLRKHAENPIDWWPWGPEALAKAREADRPIFLSIGYSSCHWCTVMEGEAFSNSAIAEFMNRHFLPIKVDREERPDLDSIYMQALQLMSGQGGWPLNVFLTPEDLVPFYAGTYFPVEPRFGRPGFLEVLQKIQQFYKRERDSITRHKTQLLEALSTLSQHTPKNHLAPDLLLHGFSKNLPIVSNSGMGQQFPMMPYAQLVLRVIRLSTPIPMDEVLILEGSDALARVQQRAMDLVLGGIFDHVAGGFHRYTVDPTWTVPHFEKMLYDNGQILEFLADIWAAGVQDPAIERAVNLTVGWLRREMTAPDGYFYAAQDADSFVDAQAVEPEEGEFYVWQPDTLHDALTGEEFDQLERAFNIAAQGNFPDRPGYLVLQRLVGGDLDPLVEQALTQKLFQARYGLDAEAHFPPARTAQEAKETPWPSRIPPVTDTKMIVAWNSLMISGLVRVYQVFGWESCLNMAVKAADFILKSQFSDGILMRLNYDGVATVAAKSEDYALLIKALLDLQQTCLPLVGEPSAQDWLAQASSLQAQMDERLWDTTNGGYFVSDDSCGSELLVREKEFQDHATPAANGIALTNLTRLASLTGELDYLDRAEQGLKTFGEMMSTQPRSCPSLFVALDWHRNFLKVTTLTDHLSILQKEFWPTTVFAPPDDPTAPLPADHAGMVCVGLKCLDPVNTFEEVRNQLVTGQNRFLGHRSGS
ncbi:MAG: thioredoxin domain-containing protein [Synechococcaceae cyanobacterium SM2_3_1]|nr:thioredoxin domain-containing protein [Synechococcaceae cyanobacterium SM2_3_1]